VSGGLNQTKPTESNSFLSLIAYSHSREFWRESRLVFVEALRGGRLTCFQVEIGQEERRASYHHSTSLAETTWIAPSASQLMTSTKEKIVHKDTRVQICNAYMALDSLR
jgi:hypothetical protein